MPRFSSLYKQRFPTVRTVQGETSYENGMMWSNQALGPGYSRTLLNLDIDSLTGVLSVSKGIKLTDVASGSYFWDKISAPGLLEPSYMISQINSRYNLKSFEGITNIISAQKITVKYGSALEQQISKQGLALSDVVCYKILTYNPVNNRLMTITLLKSKNDEYYGIDNRFKLRRLNSNPISCGLSEFWKDISEGGGEYISNILPEHPLGLTDDYIPRVRRNTCTETFKQVLHTPLYMQTVPNCEGFGNKTFCFTNKKIKEVSGPIKQTYNAYVVTFGVRLSDHIGSIVGTGYERGDIIRMVPKDTTRLISPLDIVVSGLDLGSISSYYIASRGAFKGQVEDFSAEDFDTITIPVREDNIAPGSGAEIIYSLSKNETSVSSTNVNKTNGGSNYSVGDKFIITTPNLEDTIVPLEIVVLTTQTTPMLGTTASVRDVAITHGIFKGKKADHPLEVFNVTFVPINPETSTASGFAFSFDLVDNTLFEEEEEDFKSVYLKNVNIGGSLAYDAKIDGNSYPLDLYYYGKALTGCGLRVKKDLPYVTNGHYLEVPAEYDELWSDLSVRDMDAGQTATCMLNLDDGTLSPELGKLSSPPVVDLEFVALRYIHREGSVERDGGTLFHPSQLFEKTVIKNWGERRERVHPATWLKPEILENLRKGQGFRFVTYAYPAPFEISSRKINTLAINPLTKAEEYATYWNNHLDPKLFVLEYVWDGAKWDFSFIDSDLILDNSDFNGLSSSTSRLIENWDINGRDSLGNKIMRSYAWENSLAYTDVVTEDNKADLAEHASFQYRASPWIYGAHGVDGAELTLTQYPNLSVGAEFAPTQVQSLSKMYIPSFGHFEVAPKELTPDLASRWGFNMLSSTPYTFECIDRAGTETAQFTGLLFKRVNSDEALLRPVVGTPGEICIYYDSDFTFLKNTNFFQLKMEYKTPYDDWSVLKEFSTEETHALLSSGQPVKHAFSSPHENILIRTTILDLREENKVPTASADKTEIEDLFATVSTSSVGLTFTKDAKQVEAPPKIFDLGTAIGLTYWKNRLVLWGVETVENGIFMSDPNAPDYFPYPGGFDVFDENIVHIINYSDALLVFTTTQLWKIELLEDGLNWVKTMLQQNIRVDPNDVPYITILKNMLFFKSGESFHMVVPARGSTVGELTIAPISKPIQDFLKDPFKNLAETLRTVYPELTGSEAHPKPFYDYLVKYGSHVEQNKVVIDWWFNLRDWELQLRHKGPEEIIHDVPYRGLPKTFKEYLLVQLVYDAQNYSWSLRWHTTSAVGVFLADAANPTVEFINLIYDPIEIGPGWDNTYGTYNVALHSYGDTTADFTAQEFNMLSKSITPTEPTYPRFQIFDTGYKEVSSPALKKRFREIQLTLEPRGADENDTTGIRAVLLAQIDGHTVMSAVSQEITEEVEDGVRIIKVVDRINYQDIQLSTPSVVPLPYLVDSELSNTFVLESSALSGVKLVKIRRAVNGKGHLVRMRFTNVTEANYAIVNHSFVSHNKNAR